MCEYSSVDGFANDWHLVHLGSSAVRVPRLYLQKQLQYHQREGLHPMILVSGKMNILNSLKESLNLLNSSML